MRRALAAALGVAVLMGSALVAQASSLTVDAGVLETHSVEFTFAAPSSSEDDCKNGGWEHWVDATGAEFRNQGACVSYVSGGGTLHPKPSGGEEG